MTSRREETKVRQAIVGAPKKDLLGCDEAQLVVNAGWTLLADGTAKSERTRVDRWKRLPRTSHLARPVEQLSGDAAAFVRLHRRLALANLSNLDPPRPLYRWTWSHPTAPERIASAR